MSSKIFKHNKPLVDKKFFSRIDKIIRKLSRMAKLEQELKELDINLEVRINSRDS